MARILFIFAIVAMLGLPVLAGEADPLPAETPAHKPVQIGSDRVLRVFDFEERALGNMEDEPMHWHKLSAPDLPHYVGGKLTTDRAASGQYSFRIDLNGGSCIYRYEPGMIRVRPGAHYRVSVKCQTSALPQARAQLSAMMFDQDLRPLQETVQHSELFVSPAGDSDWHDLSVELSAEDPNATFLVIELALLQKARYTDATLGKRSLFVDDIHGSAWFDDVHISQVPKVLMSTDRPGNIFRRGEPMNLSAAVNDRFTDDLAAQLIVRNALGKVVYQRTGAFDISQAESIGPGRKRLSMVVPTLPTGWYQASLEMTSHGTFVGDQRIDLVQLADSAPPLVPDSRFGVNALELPFAGWNELPQLLPLLGVGRVKLAVWSEAGDVQQMDSASFDHLLEGLQAIGVTPTACLTSPPPKLIEHVEGKTWLNLLKVDPDQWKTELAYLVSRHANHLDRWQLGADSSDEFVTNPEMRHVYTLVYNEFAKLVEHPDLAMPWPAWYEMQGELPATVALSVPPSVLPAQLPLYMQDILGHEGHNLSISLQLLDKSYGRELQIRDLAQRFVYALAGNASRIDLPMPFTVSHDSDGVSKQPQEMFMIMRTLVTTLGGCSYRGKVPMGDGIEAFCFDRAGQGVLVLWNKGSSSSEKDLAIQLGERPMRIDLWGNVSPLMQIPTASSHGTTAGSGLVKLNVGPMPIILVDIDGPLAQLRASVGFDRPLVESSFEPHTRKVRFRNTYAQSISGTLKLRAPAGWNMTPPTFTFSLNPGEWFERDVTIEFPYNSFAGPKVIDALFNLQADRQVSMTVPMTLTLGLSDVGLQTIALRDGNDVIVQQMITNYGEKPISYTAFAVYPGQPRQERIVTNLAPGRTTIKKYRLQNVDFTRKGKVRAGVKELEGTRILNDEIEIQ